MIIPEQRSFVIKGLKDDGITTIADLCKCDRATIKEKSLFVFLHLMEIEGFLKENGLRLSMDKEAMKNHCMENCNPCDLSTCEQDIIAEIDLDSYQQHYYEEKFRKILEKDLNREEGKEAKEGKEETEETDEKEKEELASQTQSHYKMPELKMPSPYEFEMRLFEIARDEYFKSRNYLISNTTRIKRAIKSAITFVFFYHAIIEDMYKNQQKGDS